MFGEGKFWVLLVALFLCVGVNIGCDDDDDIAAVAQRAKRDKAKKKKVETQVQEDKSTIGYVYDADNKRDPFKTYFDELMMQEKKNKETYLNCKDLTLRPLSWSEWLLALPHPWP